METVRTEYDKLFRWLGDNKIPFSVISNPNGKVLCISPDFDKTMGLMVRPTDENWGNNLLGLLDVIIMPDKKMGLQSADSVIQEVRELFANLH